MESDVSVTMPIENAPLYQEAYEMLLNKLVEWNRIAIEKGATKYSYEVESKRLALSVNFF